jgi:hypothetical protein
LLKTPATDKCAAHVFGEYGDSPYAAELRGANVFDDTLDINQIFLRQDLDRAAGESAPNATAAVVAAKKVFRSTVKNNCPRNLRERIVQPTNI